MLEAWAILRNDAQFLHGAENKMQILFFFKKRIQLETMRNNEKLNGVPLWSSLMGVVVQGVLQYSFERGLIAR